MANKSSYEIYLESKGRENDQDEHVEDRKKDESPKSSYDIYRGHESKSSDTKEKEGTSLSKVARSFGSGLTLGLGVSPYSEEEKRNWTPTARMVDRAAEYTGMVAPLAIGSVPTASATAARAALPLAKAGLTGISRAGAAIAGAAAKTTNWIANALGANLGKQALKGNVVPLAKASIAAGGVGGASRVIQDETGLPHLASDLVAGAGFPLGKVAVKKAFGLGPQGSSLEKAVARDLGEGLKSESSTTIKTPHGESTEVLDITPYETRLSRFENPVEGFEATIPHQLLPQVASEIELPAFSQIQRALHGTSPQLSQRMGENQKSLSNLVKAQKRGEEGSEHLSKVFQDLFKEDKNAVQEAREALRPKSHATLEDAGESAMKDVKEAYKAARKARSEAASPIYEAARESNMLIPTATQLGKAKEFTKGGVRADLQPVIDMIHARLGGQDVVPASEFNALIQDLEKEVARGKAEHDAARVFLAEEQKKVAQSLLEEHDPLWREAAGVYREHSPDVNAITEHPLLKRYLKEGRWTETPETPFSKVAEDLLKGRTSKQYAGDYLDAVKGRASGRSTLSDYARSDLLEKAARNVGEETATSIDALDAWRRSHGGADIIDPLLSGDVEALKQAQHTLQNRLPGRSTLGVTDELSLINPQDLAKHLMGGNKSLSKTEKIMKAIADREGATDAFRNAVIDEHLNKLSIRPNLQGSELQNEAGSWGKRAYDAAQNSNEYWKQVLSPEQTEALQRASQTAYDASRSYGLGKVGDSGTRANIEWADRLLNPSGGGVLSSVADALSKAPSKVGKLGKYLSEKRGRNIRSKKENIVSDVLTDKDYTLKMLRLARDLEKEGMKQSSSDNRSYLAKHFSNALLGDGLGDG